MSGNIIRDLGEGLILRQATVDCDNPIDDVEALVEFDSRVLSDAGEDSPDTRVGAWVRDLANAPRSMIRRSRLGIFWWWWTLRPARLYPAPI